MNAIHRVSVAVEDYQELALTGPPISVAPDRGGASDRFDLWFEHTDESWSEYHRGYGLYVFGTGNPVPWTPNTRGVFRFLGTVVTPSQLVWHVFTGPPPQVGPGPHPGYPMLPQ